MKVDTLGNKNNPAIIMIPGMFCTSSMPAIIGKHFEENYYIIMPNLDGHYKEEPVYYSKNDDVRELIDYLHTNHITDIALVHGTSMGAEVALELANQLDIPVRHYLYDGGPFFHFPAFFRAFMAKKFMYLVNIAKSKENEEEAENALLNDKFVKWLAGESLDSYKGMLGGFAMIGRWIDKASVRRIADTCYKCILPDLSDEILVKTTFLFSEKEPARKSEKRLRKKYPQADYYIAKGYGHGGFQIQDPLLYVEYIKGVLDD